MSPLLRNDQPQTLRLRSKQSVTLAVQAEGIDLSYQWFKDDIPLKEGQPDCYQGVTTPSLSISRVSPQHKGGYYCLVSNEEGQVTSHPQILCIGECWLIY